MKSLVIAEKPTVAKDIADVLGVTQKSKGYYHNDTYIVSNAVGHLIQLANPIDYDEKYKNWGLEFLPIIPATFILKENEKTKEQLEILKKLMSREDVSEIICATDSGREGELIFRYIYNYLKCTKPVKRLWISSLTEESIKKGFANLKPSSDYNNLYESAKCRSEADWLVGINVTRALTRKYGTMLSSGRVQTPTLSLINDRYESIKNFKSETLYNVSVILENDKGMYKAICDIDNMRNKADSEQIINNIDGKAGTISKVEYTDKYQATPQLFDLTSLQRFCNNKYGLTATETLNNLQSLYEKHKLVTYPRTDSKYISTDMKSEVKKVFENLKGSEEYNQYIEKILVKPLKFTNRIVDNEKITDHHAIIPTTANLVAINRLTDNEKKVYDAVVKNFIACFSENYEFKETVIKTSIDKYEFISKGFVVTSIGFKEIYSENEEDDENENKLPNLTNGETVNIIQSDLLTKKTAPPKYFTEATLLSAMENAGRFIEDDTAKEYLKSSGGIGTPATRANIIETLVSREYIVRKKKNLIPTEKGQKLISVVISQLKSPQITGEWEHKLNQIEKGEINSETFNNEIKKFVEISIEEIKQQAMTVDFGSADDKFPSYGICPICKGGKIRENTKAYYCDRYKDGCKFNIWKSDLKKRGIPQEQVRNMIDNYNTGSE